MKPLVLLAACAALLLAGCASADAGDDGRMPVTAAFYPLQFVAERVGGDHVRVTSLTKPGVEPHDLELTPRAVGVAGSVEGRRLPRRLPAGRRPGRDARQAPDAAVDVSPAARLTLPAGGEHAGESAQEHADHDATRARRPALLARPDPAGRRRDGARRGLRPTRPGQRRRLPRQRRRTGGDLDTLDAELRSRPRAVPHPRAGHRPRCLRLPRRALRPAPGGGRRGEPRRRARRRDAARPQRPRARGRRDDGLLREPGLPRARRDGRPRVRRPGGRARPARGHHRRLARAATTSR